MGLSFFNARRAKEKEKQKLSASIDSAETLINAKDNAPLPRQEGEELSLDPQPIEDIQVTSEEKLEETETEKEEKEKAPKEETTKKVSDAQKIKNAKQKANKTK